MIARSTFCPGVDIQSASGDPLASSPRGKQTRSSKTLHDSHSMWRQLFNSPPTLQPQGIAGYNAALHTPQGGVYFRTIDKQRRTAPVVVSCLRKQAQIINQTYTNAPNRKPDRVTPEGQEAQENYHSYCDRTCIPFAPHFVLGERRCGWATIARNSLRSLP